MTKEQAWKDINKLVFNVNIKHESELNKRFNVEIDGVRYQGIEGFYTLFKRPDGSKPGPRGKKKPGIIGQVQVDWRPSDPGTYKVNDTDLYKSIVIGAQMKESESALQQDPTEFKPGKNRPYNGKKFMTNESRHSDGISEEMAEVGNRANGVKLAINDRTLAMLTKRFLEYVKVDEKGNPILDSNGKIQLGSDPNYSFEGKGYEEQVQDLLKTHFEAGLYAARNQSELDKSRPFEEQGFHIQHFIDYRTRLYSGSHTLNYQGIKPMLAMFKLHKKKALGSTGLPAILVQAADLYSNDANTEKNRKDGRVKTGLVGSADKLMHERDRQQWTIDNLDAIIAFGRQPNSKSSQVIWDNADQPELLFTTAVELGNIAEWVNEVPGRNVADFESDLIVWQDATVSGGQHMALLSRDRYTATLVNLLTADQREDLYLEISKETFERKNGGIPLLKGTDLNGTYYSKPIIEMFKNEEEGLNLIFANHKSLYKDNDIRKSKRSLEKYVQTPEIERIAKIFWGLPSKREKMRLLAKGPVMTSFYNAGAWAMMENLLSKIKTRPEFSDISDTGLFGVKTYTNEEEGHYERDVDGFRQAMVLWLAVQMHDATAEIAYGPNIVKEFLGKLVVYIGQEYDEKSDGSTAAFRSLGKFNKQEFIQKYMRVFYGEEGSDYSVTNSYYNTLRQGEQVTGELRFAFVRDFAKDRTAISPNLIHSFDAQLVAWEALYGARDFLTIHDNFGTHAVDSKQQGDDLRSAMGQMYEGDLMVETIEYALTNDKIVKNKPYLPDEDDDVTKFINAWEEARHHILNRPLTAAQQALIGREKNEDWNPQKELENNYWAINGATGNEIYKRKNFIDDQDKAIYELINNEDFKKYGKVADKSLQVFAREAQLECQ